MILLLLAIAAGVATLLITFFVAESLAERSAVRRSLRTLDDYEMPGVRDRELLVPVGDRVFAPMLGGLTSLGRKATPAGWLEATRRKLITAGSPSGLTAEGILTLKGVGLVSGVLWIPLVWFGLGLSSLLGVVAIALLWVASFIGPDAVLNRKVEARKHAVARQLPNLLDLLVISVEAGLGFEQALDRTTDAVPGPLSEEFRRMLQEIRIGSSRSQALRALDERTEVQELRSFILAMLQADAFGVSIARILRAQADEMRVRRRIAAQELAQKAPVKMLFPLVFCIFPAIFVVVLGPAMIKITSIL
jgi:tight adherence protein C